jgi:CTP:molybdopterin cytidylyltransferase MocA
VLLEEKFAPRTNLHATLVDIKGVGVLLRGASGVGKSECALALIERGHSLVADDFVIVTLVDLPGLTADGVRRLLESPAPIAAATFDGERGHPVKFAREHWAEVITVAMGDEGARRFLAGRCDVVRVEIGDVATGADMDTNPNS